jgi:hypothetical protein
MAYSPEEFNTHNSLVETSALQVSRGIRFLLCPEEGLPKISDAEIVKLYDVWGDYARAMDISLKMTWHSVANRPMIPLAPDEDHYKPCRRMAAVIMERNVRGELSATPYLKGAVDAIRANIDSCAFHPLTCACHYRTGWTFDNEKLVNGLRWDLEQSLATQVTGTTSVKEHNVMKCACGACHAIREMNGLSEMYEKSLDKMNSYGGDSDFAKSLFETVQGVKYDSKCPHGDPFYACMSCSH